MADTPLSKTLEIRNRLGLHARAAAQLVRIAAQFSSEVTVSKDGQSVSGKSILGLMMLAAGQGNMVEVVTHGVDAEDAMAAIEQLLADKFNEE